MLQRFGFRAGAYDGAMVQVDSGPSTMSTFMLGERQKSPIMRRS